jgi:DNA (cytosine-5)-methyltransferase 1
MKPRLLDLFACQGGASAGYAAAGFLPHGVDIDPQPRYPYDFTQADALQFIAERHSWIRHNFEAVHASPPCQLYSNAQRIQGREHPDLVGPIRDALNSLGLPWVIENVEGAPLRDPVTLCGSMFGLRTYRHRLFETGGGFALAQPDHPEHTAPLRKMGRRPQPGDMIHAVGNFSGVETVRADWGVGWMNRDGIREAIPPAYSLAVGRELMAHLGAAVPA